MPLFSPGSRGNDSLGRNMQIRSDKVIPLTLGLGWNGGRIRFHWGKDGETGPEGTNNSSKVALNRMSTCRYAVRPNRLEESQRIWTIVDSHDSWNDSYSDSKEPLMGEKMTGVAPGVASSCFGVASSCLELLFSGIVAPVRFPRAKNPKEKTWSLATSHDDLSAAAAPS